MKSKSLVFSLGVITALAAFGNQAQAIEVTQDTIAANLSTAILGSAAGITVTSESLSFQSLAGAASTGTYTNNSGIYGNIGPGIVLSSGIATNYGDGSNTSTGFSTSFGTTATAAQQALINPITGVTGYDVTQLDLTFDVDGSTSSIFFNVVWGSDEYDEFVNTQYKDAFGIYLNGTNIALFNATPVNVDHPLMKFTSGTELDGVLDPSGDGSNPIMLFQGAVTPNSTNNQLTFIIADTGDHVLDSTVYISGLGGQNPGGGNPGGGGVVPIPAALPLFLTALGGLGALGWRKRSAA
jgi:hypothetical protein